MQAVLTVEEGPLEGQKRWIRQDERLTIGASAWSDFEVDCKQLQPMHMVMSLSADGCLMQTVNNARMWINGDVASLARLRHRDRVHVGQFAFRVELNGVAIPADGSPIESPPEFALPLSGTRMATPQLVERSEHDAEFSLFEPAPNEYLAQDFIERVMDRSSVYLLCRFDRWSFPCPPELADCVSSVPEVNDRSTLQYLFRLVLLRQELSIRGHGVARLQ